MPNSPESQIARVEERMVHMQRDVVELDAKITALTTAVNAMRDSAEFNRGYSSGVSATLRTQWLVFGAIISTAVITAYRHLFGGAIK